MKNISIIGLGSMGSAMASVLLDKGYQVYVWNRSPDKAGELVRKGARYVSTVGEAIRASKTSIVCVSITKRPMKFWIIRTFARPLWDVL